ncbi:YdaS family helix-turn-helix protein [Rhizobium tumorigenes]|uniref:YdaS family helix-turn-helix protein n=1 Tax=Rhizobium tumorigenes TaxID=2041385 RepID=UPI003100DD86
MKTGMEAVKEQIQSMADLARGLGLTRGAIAQWERVPAERVPAVSQLTGLPGRIIRPDLYEDRALSSGPGSSE